VAADGGARESQCGHDGAAIIRDSPQTKRDAREERGEKSVCGRSLVAFAP